MQLEKVKSGLMGLLLTSCILLASLILYDFQGSSSKSEATRVINQTNISYDSFIYPQSCSMSFGGGLYKGVYAAEVKQGLWQESKKYLKNYLEFLEVSKIPQQDWDTAVKSKSVSFVMPFEMNLGQLQGMLLPDHNGMGHEEITFDTIIVPINADEQIFLGNREKNAYFQLKGIKRDVYLNSLLTQYEKAEGVYDSKTIEALYAPSKVLSKPNEPFDVNEVLFPIAAIPNIPFIKVEDEVDVKTISEQSLKEFVGKAFGSRNDFLKMVEDIDGSLVYLYGYSERALKLGADGVITYKKRFDKTTSGSEYTFKEGLKVAAAELSNFGTLPNQVYLSGYTKAKDKEGNLVSQYQFNYEMDQLPIYSEDGREGQPLVVELTGNQVTSVSRKVSHYLRPFSVSEIWDEPLDMLSIFEINFDIFSKNFAKYDYKPQPEGSSGPNGDSTFAVQMLQQVDCVTLIYFAEKGKADSLVPSWHIRLGSVSYVVNIYSGEILKEILPEGVK